MGQTFDPITLEILWRRLISIVDEADTTVARTAFSSLLRDAHDYTCMFTDRRGRELAQGSFATPGQSGAMALGIKNLVKTLRDEGNEIWLRPETTGKGTQFGTLDEIIKLSEDIDGVLPCTDFSHMHARANGGFEYDEFMHQLAKLENRLGRHALDNMHIHLSGIEYTEKGEKRHLPLEDSDFEYKDILKALKDFNARGIVVCESPVLEDDARVLKNYYTSL